MTTPTSPLTTPDARELADWNDPRVQLVYKLVCADERPPNPEEHWEGWLARRIVAALRSPIAGQELREEEWPLPEDEITRRLTAQVAIWQAMKRLGYEPTPEAVKEIRRVAFAALSPTDGQGVEAAVDVRTCSDCNGAGDDGHGHTCYTCDGQGGVVPFYHTVPTFAQPDPQGVEAAVGNGQILTRSDVEEVIDRLETDAVEYFPDAVRLLRYMADELAALSPTDGQGERDNSYEHAAKVADYGVERATRDWRNPVAQEAAAQVSGEIAEVIRSYKSDKPFAAVRAAPGIFPVDRQGVEAAVEREEIYLVGGVTQTNPEYEADENGNPLWQAEVQVVGGHSFVATVYGGTEKHARRRAEAIARALNELDTIRALSTSDTDAQKGVAAA